MTLTVELTEDIAACRALRREVFIEEQGVSEADEVDTLDPEALHLLATRSGVALGTARLLVRGDTLKIGRVCVLQAYRGEGVGAELMRAALDVGRSREGLTRAFLGAQTTALSFYLRLGFQPIGEVYEEAGLLHQDMECPL